MKQSRACELAHSCAAEWGIRDPVALCMQLGILVQTAVLPEGMDGMLYRMDGRPAVLLSSAIVEDEYRRYVCACACLLRHALLHEQPGGALPRIIGRTAVRPGVRRGLCP